MCTTSNSAHLLVNCSTSSFKSLFSFSSAWTFLSACIFTDRTIPVQEIQLYQLGTNPGILARSWGPVGYSYWHFNLKAKWMKNNSWDWAKIQWHFLVKSFYWSIVLSFFLSLLVLMSFKEFWLFQRLWLFQNQKDKYRLDGRGRGIWNPWISPPVGSAIIISLSYNWLCSSRKYLYAECPMGGHWKFPNFWRGGVRFKPKNTSVGGMDIPGTTHFRFSKELLWMTGTYHLQFL